MNNTSNRKKVSVEFDEVDLLKQIIIMPEFKLIIELISEPIIHTGTPIEKINKTAVAYLLNND